jgi:hypothetical protein
MVRWCFCFKSLFPGFYHSDPEKLVSGALSVIPAKTKFHDCISDVLSFYKQYPDDWKSAWFELQKKWDRDVGCPKGVFLSFNIDAKINSAYVALALLYGRVILRGRLTLQRAAGRIPTAMLLRLAVFWG